MSTAVELSLYKSTILLATFHQLDILCYCNAAHLLRLVNASNALSMTAEPPSSCDGVSLTALALQPLTAAQSTFQVYRPPSSRSCRLFRPSACLASTYAICCHLRYELSSFPYSFVQSATLVHFIRAVIFISHSLSLFCCSKLEGVFES